MADPEALHCVLEANEVPTAWGIAAHVSLRTLRDLFGKIEQPLTGITAHLCAKARWSQQQLSVSRSASFPHGAVQSGEHFALQTCEVGVGEVIELAEFSVVNHDFVEECFALALTEPAVEVFPFVFAYGSPSSP